MQLKWLEDFEAYAVTRSFTKAAELRNVTHPAFGRRIRALESWVGVPLIDRGAFPAVLTPAGVDFLEVARAVSSDLNGVRTELRRRHTRDGRVLTIATGRTLARTFFPRVHQAIGRMRPQVPIRLITASVHDAMNMLADETVDLVLCYSGPSVEIDPAIVESRSVGAERLVAVRGPAGPELSGRGRARVPLLNYSETMALGRVLRHALAARGLTERLETIFESDLAETLLDGVKLGRGIAWLPEALVAGEIAGGALARADAPEQDISIEIRLCRRRRDLRPKGHAIWRHILAQMAAGGA
ncbi:LysR family transcriptional regulator [Azorhizobium doebereinerae]|uniref:LysR family transcriptional regulator n=1 Tax=Azorhizobium doebereinerae TaxID=281091 RepID=UPI00041369F7|nr:LysR substrate-binding domain-containing protein [Azorhizobium doebereinerae]